MTEIVGGVSIRDVAEGGAVFEVRPATNWREEDEDDDYVKQIGYHGLLDCMESEENALEPFDVMSEKMENLIPSGKIKKKTLKEGYGSKPHLGCHVRIHYNAYVQYDAQPFDSTYARKKPFTFTLGEGHVIEGLDIAVPSMRLNEKSRFLIDSDLAYKNSGLNRIPPNSTVLFEIELTEILLSIHPEDTTTTREFKDVYKHCLTLCVRGKNQVQLKDYDGAAKQYSSAIKKLEDALLNDYEEQLKSEELLVRLNTNLLVCYTQLQIPKKGCIAANNIYKMSRNNTFKVSAKVYFNNAKCLKMLGDLDMAERRLYKAKQIEPTNAEIQHELRMIKEAKEKCRTRDEAFGKALLS